MIKLYAIIAATCVTLVGLGGAYVKGRNDGKAIEAAQRIELVEVARTAADAANAGAAAAIAKISIVHTTIRSKAEVITREVPVYRDCINDPGIVSLLDAARANRAVAEPASIGDRVVP